jgi:hypothetical protein
MKLIQFIAVTMFFLQSCDSNDEEKPCCNVDLDFQIEMIDSSGNDLLNPSFGGSFNHSEISYYKFDEDSNKVEMILENNFIIAPSNNGVSKYFLNITEIGTKQSDGSYLSYLKLSSDITDTVKVKTIEENGNVYKDKIWYNDNLVWEKTGLSTLPIVITK